MIMVANVERGFESCEVVRPKQGHRYPIRHGTYRPGCRHAIGTDAAVWSAACAVWV